MQGFQHIHPITVRFRDIDALGHVNNAVILTYVESARVPYLVALGVRSPRAGIGDIAFIVAYLDCNFRQPILYGQQVEVGTRATRIGNSSMRLEHRIEADGKLAAEGHCVLVHYNYAAGHNIPVTPEMVSKIETFEGRKVKQG